MQFHNPVLLSEVINWMVTDKNGIYVDCTLGHGGHSLAALEKISSTGKLIGIDQDQKSLSFAQERLKKFNDKQIHFELDNFVNLKKILQKLKILNITGILYDLGFSAEQIYNPERGFSYHFDAPLDMRMNQRQTLKAADIIENYSLQELNKIFKIYGEEKYAFAIANKIIEQRKLKKILTTKDLLTVIRMAMPKIAQQKKHPGRKTFQALRIAVNNELEVLEHSIRQGVEVLKPGGRMIVISYHSLEDRITKKIFKQLKNIKILTKTPITPSEEELRQNHSARSAKLRVIEKNHEE